MPRASRKEQDPSKEPDLSKGGPKLEQKEYSFAQLENGLRVLVVSSDRYKTGIMSGSAAATLTVEVGSWDDPVDVPGLAHFCEHMLFLSKPEEEDPDYQPFSTYLGDHAGRCNASTGPVFTDYYFSVQEEDFDDALSKFGQLFSCANFESSSVASEISAVDSEHQKNKQSDGWRLWQLFLSLGDTGFKGRQFSTGSREVLSDVKDLHSRVAKFFNEYYLPKRMWLVVFAPLSETRTHEAVHEAVATAFSKFRRPCKPAPSADWYKIPVRREDYGRAFTVGGNANLGKTFAVVPVRKDRLLKIQWVLDSQRNCFRSEPVELVAALVGHSGPGGLMDLLRNKKQWVTDARMETEVATDQFTVASLTVSLTDLGFAHVGKVQAHVYRLFAQLGANPGAVHDFWNGIAAAYSLSYNYTPVHGAVQITSGLGRRLFEFPPNLVLHPPTMHAWSVHALAAVLKQLTRARSVTFLVSPDSAKKNLEWKTEAVYGTKYAQLEEKEEESVEGVPFSLPRLDARFTPRPKCLDNLLADQSALGVGDDQRTFEAPEELLDVFSGARVWWQPKSLASREPTVILCANIMAGSMAGATAWAHRMLFAALFERFASVELSAGSFLSRVFSLSVKADRFSLSVSGYADRFEDFAVACLEKLHEEYGGKWLAGIFEQVKTAVTLKLEAAYHEQPREQARYFAEMILDPKQVATDDLIAAVKNATEGSIREFAKVFRDSALRTELLVAGNIDRDTASELVKKLLPLLLPGRTQVSAPPPRFPFVLLEAGTNLVFRSDVRASGETTSATRLAFQLGPWSELETTLLGRMLGAILGQPFYNALRTEQCLGYTVVCDAVVTNGVVYLVFLVQGSGPDQANPLTAVELTAAVHKFIQGESVWELVQNEETVELHVQALSGTYTQKTDTLEQASGAAWERIDDQTYEFDVPQCAVEWINDNAQSVSGSLWELFSSKVLEPATRSLLTVEIYGAVNHKLTLGEKSGLFAEKNGEEKRVNKGVGFIQPKIFSTK